MVQLKSAENSNLKTGKTRMRRRKRN